MKPLVRILVLLMMHSLAYAKDIQFNPNIDKEDAKYTQECKVGDRIGIRWYPGAVVVNKEGLDLTRIEVKGTADAGPDDNGNDTVWYMFKAKKVGTIRIEMQWCDPKKCQVRGFIVNINP